MEHENRRILKGISMLDLEGNKYLKELYGDRVKTIEYYRKRLKDFGEPYDKKNTKRRKRMLDTK